MTDEHVIPECIGGDAHDYLHLPSMQFRSRQKARCQVDSPLRSPISRHEYWTQERTTQAS